MINQWTPEINVTQTLAIALIHAQFDLTVKNIKPLGQGWDNVAYLINDQFVFRFPQRELAVKTIKNECLLLPLINSTLDCHTPKIIYAGKPSENYPWPFMGYALLEGKTACHVTLTDAQRLAIAPDIFHAITQLHKLTIPEAIQNQFIGEGRGLVDTQERRTRNIDLLKKVAAITHHSALNTLITFVENFPHLTRDTKKVLVHGDFYIRHVLVNDHKKFAGIIDWGDTHFNESYMDLAFFFTFLPGHEAQKILKLNQTDLYLSLIWAIFSAANMGYYGINVNDRHLVDESRRSFEYIQQTIMDN